MERKSTMLKMLQRFCTDSGVISEEKILEWVSYVKILNKEEEVLEEAYEAFTEIKIVEKKACRWLWNLLRVGLY
jgi:ATP-binding cassette subfamily F protein 3